MYLAEISPTSLRGAVTTQILPLIIIIIIVIIVVIMLFIPSAASRAPSNESHPTCWDATVAGLAAGNWI